MANPIQTPSRLDLDTPKWSGNHSKSGNSIPSTPPSQGRNSQFPKSHPVQNHSPVLPPRPLGNNLSLTILPARHSKVLEFAAAPACSVPVALAAWGDFLGPCWEFRGSSAAVGCSSVWGRVCCSELSLSAGTRKSGSSPLPAAEWGWDLHSRGAAASMEPFFGMFQAEGRWWVRHSMGKGLNTKRESQN